MEIRRGKVWELTPAIPFSCFVNGEKLLAVITHQEESYIETIYRVRFSDGYESTFVYYEGVWYDGKLRTAYVEAIEDDLQAMLPYMIDDEEQPFSFEFMEAEGCFNVWLMPADDIFSPEGQRYMVVYKGDLGFFVNESYEPSTLPSQQNAIDQNIARMVKEKLIERNAAQ
ncbi:MAG: hypothetical protein EOO01_44755 [Chitinophagaceae bacterium]|nr:MAG: hypothetical protein EOO01_44755 [Chitinophagaceae bacterium]